MKLIILALISLLATENIYSQSITISGNVKDNQGVAIPFANVAILELQLVVNSDNSGEFQFSGIKQGKYTLKVFREGYQSETVTYDTDNPLPLQLVLSPSALAQSAITVTAKSGIADILSSPQSVDVIAGRELERKRGQNIVSAMTDTPGVSSVATGPGVAKPVIRGLSGQRILVLTDGVRQEDQQFGDEHTLELDALGVEKIEIVKGPSSLLYGADAMGGVINVVRLKAPMSGNTLDGNVHYGAFSENNSDMAGLDLYGNAGGIGYRAMVSGKKAGKLESRNGRLPNTGFKEENKSVSAGTAGNWGSIYLDSFQRIQVQEIYDNPNESIGSVAATPLQRLRHEKNHLNSVINLSAGKLETDLGYQRNHRREQEDKNMFLPQKEYYEDPSVNLEEKLFHSGYTFLNQDSNGLNLFLDTATADVRFHHNPVGGLKGSIGVSGIQQKNSSVGTEALIPSYYLTNIAAYLYEEYRLKQFTFSAGARSDKRILDVKQNEDLGNPATTRNYYANTGAMGVVWKNSPHSSLGLNYSSGYRSPTPFELFSNGVHEGSGRFEKGNIDLKPEYSRSLDFTYRYIASTFHAEIGVFQNTIDNYIYSVSTNNTDADSSLPIYQYKQDKSVLKGLEIDLQYEFSKWMAGEFGASVIRGRNDRTTHWLPGMPADNFRAGLRFLKNQILFFKKPYFEIKTRYFRKQNLVDPNEAPSQEYTLLDVGLGWEIEAFSRNGKNAVFDLAVKNLTNQKYAPHLSRYRAYAVEPGTNMEFKLTIPFTFWEKQ